jgi:long-chain acyl-CoA synthetase
LLPEKHEGSIRVRTPVSVDGYLDDSSQTEMPFEHRYFDTGDTGYVTPEKMLIITGRKKEVLNLGGDKVSPMVIEDVLTMYYGVREAVAFAAPNALGIDEVWALVVPTGTLDESALQTHCREKLAQTHVPVRFITVAELPRNANGKVDRARLSALVQEIAGSSV